MSSVQPESGLPERRVITADSFRALKLKLSAGHRRLAQPPHLPRDLPIPDLSLSPRPQIEPAVARDDSPAVVETMEISPAVEADLVPDEEAPDPHAPELQGFVSSPMPVGEVELEPVVDPDDVAIPEDSGQEHDEPEPEVLPPSPSVPLYVDRYFGAPPQPIEDAPAPQSPEPVSLLADFVDRRMAEESQVEDIQAGQRAHELLEIMAMPSAGSLPQERALANDTLLRLIPRMPLRDLRHLAERVCLMESPSQMLVRRLINDPRIEVSGPLLENAMTVNDNELIAVAKARSSAKLKRMARRRIVSPALSEALIQSNHVETLINLVRNPGATFSIESLWHLTRFATAHPVLQAPLVTRADTPSPIAFQLFWHLPSELRRYVLSRFLTDSETITKILTMNIEGESNEHKFADLSLLAELETASPEEAGAIYCKLTNVSPETGARIADDPGGEAQTVALKAAGLTRAQFAGIVGKRADAEALRVIFETLSFNKARVLLTYWDWAAKRTGPYARTAAA